MDPIREYLRRIGSNGGKKRMKSMTKGERSRLARKAGKASGRARRRK